MSEMSEMSEMNTYIFEVCHMVRTTIQESVNETSSLFITVNML